LRGQKAPAEVQAKLGHHRLNRLAPLAAQQNSVAGDQGTPLLPQKVTWVASKRYELTLERSLFRVGGWGSGRASFTPVRLSANMSRSTSAGEIHRLSSRSGTAQNEPG
jgi:hypothetical protein